MDRDYEKTLEILREAHREPIAEAHFAAVRARVLAQLAAQRRPWWRGMWAYGFLAAAMVAVCLAAFWPKDTAERRPAPALAAAEQPAEALPDGRAQAAAVPARKRLPAARARRRRRAPALAEYRTIGPPNPQPLVVKLVTNDPNVVIYWISGE